MSKKRGRTLSEDDLSVWQSVARTTNPLHPGKRVSSDDGKRPAPKPVEGPRQTPQVVIPEFRIGETATLDHSKGHNLTPTLEQRLAAQPIRMDRKAYRNLKRGKLRPERKIDLHGMSLAQAHPALSRFIIRAQAEGCRLVLVVTGKGKSQRDTMGPIPMPRGLLRNQVPAWLHLPPLGSLVLQVTDAHQSHGGSGAYYVYLARRR